MCANYYLQIDFNLPRAEEALRPAELAEALRPAELAEAGAQPRVWGGRMSEETRRATIAVLRDSVFCVKAQLGQNGGQRQVLLSDCELYSSVFSHF